MAASNDKGMRLKKAQSGSVFDPECPWTPLRTPLHLLTLQTNIGTL